MWPYSSPLFNLFRFWQPFKVRQKSKDKTRTCRTGSSFSGKDVCGTAFWDLKSFPPLYPLSHEPPEHAGRLMLLLLQNVLTTTQPSVSCSTRIFGFVRCLFIWELYYYSYYTFAGSFLMLDLWTTFCAHDWWTSKWWVLRDGLGCGPPAF